MGWSAPASRFQRAPFLLHRQVLAGVIVPPPRHSGHTTYYQLFFPDNTVGIGGSFDLSNVALWKQHPRRSTDVPGDNPVPIDVQPSETAQVITQRIVLWLTGTKRPDYFQSRLVACRLGSLVAVTGQLLYLAFLAHDTRQTSLFFTFCDPYPHRPRRLTRQMVLLTQVVTVAVPYLRVTYSWVLSAGHLCLSFVLIIATMLFCLDSAWDLTSIACLALAWYCVDMADGLRAPHLVLLQE